MVSVQTLAERSSRDPAGEKLPAELSIAKTVHEILDRLYPGHYWATAVDVPNGVCLITIPILLGNWKYKIPLPSVSVESVREAGGQILERFNMARGKMDLASFLEAKKHAVSRHNQTPPGGLK